MSIIGGYQPNQGDIQKLLNNLFGIIYMAFSGNSFFLDKIIFISIGLVIMLLGLNKLVVALALGSVLFAIDTFIHNDKICLNDVYIFSTLSIVFYAISYGTSILFDVSIYDLDNAHFLSKYLRNSLYVSLAMAGAAISEFFALIFVNFKTKTVN